MIDHTYLSFMFKTTNLKLLNFETDIGHRTYCSYEQQGRKQKGSQMAKSHSSVSYVKKRFSDNENITRHKHIHTEMKSFKFCDKKFIELET